MDLHSNMPFVVTTEDQDLNTVGLLIDPQLALTLDPNTTYVVQALLRWQQANLTDGGFQCKLAMSSGPDVDLSWTGTGDTTDRATGAPLQFVGTAGPRLVTMTAILTTGPNAPIISVYRGLVNPSGNDTTLRSYSVL